MKRTTMIPWRSRRSPAKFSADPAYAWQRELDRFFEGFSQLRPLSFGETVGDFRPRANVSESSKEIVVTIELPGLDEDDIDITLKQDVLTIEGEKKLETEEDEGNFYRMERRYGSFTRTFRLPNDVIEADSIEASFANGVLTIHLPKREEEVEISKRITVQAG